MASLMQSSLLIIPLVLFLIGVTSGNSGAKFYWKTKLPNTPMPSSVFDSLATQDNSDVWLSTHNKAHKWTHSDEAMLQAYEGGCHCHCHVDAMKNMDTMTTTFFLEKDLTSGSMISVHFKDGLSGSVNTRFPSSALIHAMPPFKSSHLLNNLRFFNVDASSDTAMFMNLTLSTCEHPNSINGKSQHCATSLEDLVSYVTSTLGGELRAISAPESGSHRDELVSYKVVGVRQVASEENLVACHRLGFPYTVYYCHQPKGTTAYAVTLVDVINGAKSNAYAVCHSQTAEWSPKYVGFKVLGVKPGTHVCHFLQFHDLVWFRG